MYLSKLSKVFVWTATSSQVKEYTRQQRQLRCTAEPRQLERARDAGSRLSATRSSALCLAPNQPKTSTFRHSHLLKWNLIWSELLLKWSVTAALQHCTDGFVRHTLWVHCSSCCADGWPLDTLGHCLGLRQPSLLVTAGSVRFLRHEIEKGLHWAAAGFGDEGESYLVSFIVMTIFGTTLFKFLWWPCFEAVPFTPRCVFTKFSGILWRSSALFRSGTLVTPVTPVRATPAPAPRFVPLLHKICKVIMNVYELWTIIH